MQFTGLPLGGFAVGSRSRSGNHVPVDTAALERLCADAWPAVLERPLGEWRMRAAGGYTGRANSALAVGDPGMPVPRALGQVVRFAAGAGIRPCAQVMVGSPVQTELAAAGWVINHAHPRGAESAVLVGEMPDAVEAEGVSVHGSAPAGWWRLAVGSDEPTPAQRHVLGTGPQVGFGSCVRGGQLVGVVRGCVVTQYLLARWRSARVLHIAGLVVRPDQRRRGVARSLLAGLDRWAADRGATRRILQVATHNQAAMGLYAGLGYVEHHRYRYWIPGGD
jgi:ribosomal protein S18 acetylase RimI-like enzyme